MVMMLLQSWSRLIKVWPKEIFGMAQKMLGSTNSGQLKYKCITFTCSTKSSWVWRKLLRLRPLTSQFPRARVNDGESTVFWSDYWHPMGRLIDIVGKSGPQRLGLGRYETVAAAANEAGWQFRRCRDHNLQQVIASTP
ncbi:hypothetical protein YC2023_102915 [Brassica napus]